jgi:hypothetical protein
VIHYHGGPITPADAAVAAWAGRHGMVSFEHQQSLDIALEVCQSVVLDNGAFSAWRAGRPVKDWRPFYEWSRDLLRHPAVDWALMPDVIDGNERDNDALLAEWPHHRALGVPVWHMHESLARLARLCDEWPRVALGSSGEFAVVGDAKWWRRINEAMHVACDDEGYPRAKLHGLRMLDPEVFTRLPFASADSTNVARNIGIDGAWRGTYTPSSKGWRAQVLCARIEAQQSARTWARQMRQADFLGEAA